MENLVTRFIPVWLVLFSLTISSCDSNDPSPAPPGIEGTMLQAEGARGTVVSIPLTLRAETGIKSLTITAGDGISEVLSIGAGETEAVYTHLFEIPVDAPLGAEYTLEFLLTDSENVTSTVTAVVRVGKLIETPATYTFAREGVSTVAYSGQTNRLNQVAEIKAYLRSADAGGGISEQVLLDMFANTGGNGGGNFTFTSTTQLKDKTFAPDLDSRLFEDIFARAAAASINGSNGVQAGSGTAGLLTREGSGNTVLVDENGREFTQVIEKGLMGAVFYNQIFNTYLTDTRTGDDVENVLTGQGNAYTLMEHHWDEAFGYWDPPVDFTSNWPAARGGELRFWSNYSNVVDNVRDGLLGTNDLIMNAFKEGRTAIVNNDMPTKNARRDELYEHLERVAAASAVHYLNGALQSLGDGQTGEALHVLSEAWAFINALKYSPRRALDLSEIEQMLETDLGENGNFWNATPLGLNSAKAKLVAAYPALMPVQDDL